MDRETAFGAHFGDGNVQRNLSPDGVAYCKELLRNVRKSPPESLCDSERALVERWRIHVRALMEEALKIARAGEKRSGAAFDHLKKVSMRLADAVFPRCDRGIVFCQVAKVFDDAAFQLAESVGKEPKNNPVGKSVPSVACEKTKPAAVGLKPILHGTPIMTLRDQSEIRLPLLELAFRVLPFNFR